MDSLPKTEALWNPEAYGQKTMVSGTHHLPQLLDFELGLCDLSGSIIEIFAIKTLITLNGLQQGDS